MNHDEIREYVKRQMPEHRWQHTLGVIESAKQLAKQYGADVNKAELAAIVHDVAKYRASDSLRELIVKAGLRDEVLAYNSQLWHAPVGAWIAEQELGIHDEEVLQAIRYHTSGRVGMSLLEKVVCLADYIEPGRKYPGVERIRELAQENINLALVSAFDSTIRFLIEKGARIYPLTVQARNDLIE